MSEAISDPGIPGITSPGQPEATEPPFSTNIEVTTDQSLPVMKAGALSIVTALINGAGVGLLLGTLLGLSISPVVSGVIATLSGLLAVLLGISEKYISPLKSIRIGAFGFFCVVGILLGMYIRINKGLLPSREKMMTGYLAVGFTEEEARDFIAYREFGLVPAGWTGKAREDQIHYATLYNDTIETGGNGQATTDKPVVRGAERQFANPEQPGAELKSVLYSSEINSGECYKLNLANINQSVVVVKSTFERAGGTWKKLAVDLSGRLPDSIYVQALFTIRDCICQSGQSGVIKVSMDSKIRKINGSHSLEQIKQIMSGAGGLWPVFVEKISDGIPAVYQKSVFLSLIKIFRS